MTTALLFIVVLGPLIFFHEFGHFIVARLFGVGVEKFSLGFGPPIIGKKIGRTEYRISWIPLGGYVKMVGESPDAEISPEDLPYSFTHKHVAKRSLIVFAGPFFNAVLALLIFVFVYFFMGIPSVTSSIRAIDEDGPAAKAGLKIGDRITAVNGTTVENWHDIKPYLHNNKGEALNLDILRQSESFVVEVKPQEKVYENVYGEDAKEYYFGMEGQPRWLAIVGKVVKKTPAAKAGLQKGDRIVSIGGQQIQYWTQMSDLINASEGKTLKFGVKRNDETLTLDVTPSLDKDRNIVTGQRIKLYRVGIVAKNQSIHDLIIDYTLMQSVKTSGENCVIITKTFFVFLGKAFQGKVSRGLVGGPIRIAMMAHETAKMGFRELLFFAAAISLQLAILNLLPIPVLDGGHLAFYGIEAIKGKPLGIRTREVAQQVGLFLLLLLMVFVIYNDFEFTLF